MLGEDTNLGYVEIVLGVLVVAASICPSIWSDIVLGILVIVFGALILIRAKAKPAQGRREAEAKTV